MWIRHLLLAALAHDSQSASGSPTTDTVTNLATPPPSLLVGRPRGTSAATVRLRSVADPRSLLERLLRLYSLGQAVPLPLFPMTSRAYVETLRASASERALRAARDVIQPRSSEPTERDMAYVRLVFGESPLAGLDDTTPHAPADLPPPAPTFVAVARELFEPLLDHREEI
jgi:exonuclease V gamma subunit